MPTVITRLPGRRKPLLPNWQLPLPPTDGGDGGSTTLRELIARIVHQQVVAFRKRQEGQQLITVLSAEEIRSSAERGRVLTGGLTDIGTQDVDDEMAVGAALQAFEDGMYLVFIDDVEQTDLDAQVYVSDDSTITFIRLTFLAGA